MAEGIAAVIYCRISQDRAGEGAGVERQERDCRALAEQLGWEVAHVYVDNDVSAYSAKPRPEYRAMIDRIRGGQVGGLLAWHTDRLYRSIPDLSELVEVCDAANVQIRTVKAGKIDLTTPSGRLNALMFAGIARYEVERSAERVKAAKDQQALNGKFRGGARPFGYLDGGMELHQTEAARLREAAGEVLAGRSLMSVVKRWNREGIQTARGRKWTVTSLRKVLVRGRNAALVERTDGTVIGPAQWPEILTRDELTAVRAILSDPARRTATSFERRHAGAGIYRCGKCGGVMRVFTSTAGKTGNDADRNYMCFDHHHLSAKKGPLDEYVSEVVTARLSQPDILELLTPADQPDLSGLSAERNALQARKDELARLFAAGDIDGSQLRSGSADLQRRIDAIGDQLAVARQASPVSELAMSGDVRARWDGLDADVKGKVIDSLMTVTVLPVGSGRSGRHVSERVQIEWK